MQNIRDITIFADHLSITQQLIFHFNFTEKIVVSSPIIFECFFLIMFVYQIYILPRDIIA